MSLYLGYDNTFPTPWTRPAGMKDITGLDRIELQQIFQFIILKGDQVTIPVDGPVETGDKFRPIVCLHNIPHLRFAKSAMAFFRQFIVGMHLDGETVVGIDVFYQEGKFVPN